MFQTDGGDFIVLKEHNIRDQGEYVSKNEADDWVLFRIELLNHGLSPPPVETEIEQTLKIHIFGYPNVGDLNYDTSEIDQCPPSGACIQAEVAQIRPGHFLINAHSHHGLSGAAVVCDRSGGILGIICGQWKDFQAFAVSIHRLPDQKRYSPPSSPDEKTTDKKQKVATGN